MGTRFENFDLGRALAKFLNIKGQKNQPTVLNTDEVMCVVDLMSIQGQATPQGGEGLEVFQDSGLTSIAGLPVNPFNIIWTGTVNNPFPIGQNLAYRIDTLMLYLQFDVPGATAFNGKKIAVALEFWDTTDTNGVWRIIRDHPGITISTGRIDYFWGINGHNNDNGPAKSGSGWAGRCPPRLSPNGSGFIGLKLIVQSIDGSNFPANTKVSYQTTGRQSTNGIVPRGP